MLPELEEEVLPELLELEDAAVEAVLPCLFESVARTKPVKPLLLKEWVRRATLSEVLPSMVVKFPVFGSIPVTKPTCDFP